LGERKTQGPTGQNELEHETRTDREEGCRLTGKKGADLLRKRGLTEKKGTD
jgi:hypothetical protein